MENLLSLIYILVPSSLVLFGMYLTVKTFVGKEFEKTRLDIKKKNKEQILPTRLAAYERLCLFLERITLSNLVIRVNNPEFNVAMLHAQLLSDIRNEFNHNLSQQIYVSDEAWTLIKKAVEETTSTINQAANNIADKELRGIELGKTIFNLQSNVTHDPVTEAILYLKNEIRKSF